MNKETTNKLVPKLRFPEFREAGAWEKKTLGEITYKVSKKNNEGIKLPIYSINNKEGFLPQSDQFDGIDSNNRGYDISLYKIIERNTFAYNPARINVGSIGYSGDLHNIIISSLYVCFKTKEIINDLFLLFFFRTYGFNKLVENNVEGGIRNYLFYENFARINIILPIKEEQQEIADCLYSIDELIKEQNQKLDTLKAHKKGLMQQLFPAEDETVPKLRFPEFRDAGEWEEKTLGEYLLQHPDYGVNAPAVPFSDNLPTYIRITDISENGQFLRNQMVSVAKEVTKDNYLSEGDIVLARTGASVGKSYKYRIEDGKLVFAGFLIRVKPDKKKINSELLFQFLSTKQYWHWVEFISARSGQPGINGNEYASMPLSLPPTLAEQQKIADCLSSIDELITAQNQKVEALKAHKKGLMQQLFPNTDEVK
jgi:type I restriction enzyme S subunit